MARFRMEDSRVLAVDLAGDAVKAKNGAMVAYDGSMTFKRLSGGGEGLRGLVTRRITGESMTVMEVRGQGTCYFADRASEITLVRLAGEKLYVEASNLLCTEATLRTGTTFTGLRGASEGHGLFTTTVEGAGQAALLSDGPAIALRPPEPSNGKRFVSAAVYHMRAFCAGGSSVKPVLFGELFTGFSGLNFSPDCFVSKLKSQ